MTPEHLRHQDVMRNVARALHSVPYVLKGGTALLLLRGLDRHSTDLDFDALQPADIDGPVRQGFHAAGVSFRSLTISKDTPITRRCKYHYEDAATGKDVLLKVEVSFRSRPDTESYESIDGIRTYKIPYLYDQKLAAFNSRWEARDLYDLSFLLGKYGNQLTDSQVAALLPKTDSLERLVEDYSQSWVNDEILGNTHDLEETILNLRVSIEERMGKPSSDIFEVAKGGKAGEG